MPARLTFSTLLVAACVSPVFAKDKLGVTNDIPASELVAKVSDLQLKVTRLQGDIVKLSSTLDGLNQRLTDLEENNRSRGLEQVGGQR